MRQPEQVPVLVVGGAVVGLSTALFLSWHGVPTVLVERHPSALRHPRARAINPRALELFRRVGLEPAILAARSVTADFSRKALVRAETLAGPETHSAPLSDEAPELTEDITPCRWCVIDQNRLEEILAARAAGLGADLRYSTELVSFDQDEDGVTAVLRDLPTGTEHTVRAGYLVAADGYRSPVRTRLGIPAVGPGTLMHLLSVVFTADLTGPLRGRDVGLAHLDRPESGTLLIPLDGDRWVFYTPYHPERGESVDSFDERRCTDAIRDAIGIPDLRIDGLEVQIPATGTTVLGFELASQVAERFRDGRVFLAGDAAHTMVPTGAFGASTGIQDGHNLAWKLAAVTDGTAGPGLLDSYDVERRSIAHFTVGQAMAHQRGRAGAGRPDEVVGYGATILGYRYRSTAVIGADGDGGPPAVDVRTVGGPGTRAPHLVLERDGRRLSTLDLFGPRFMLLTGADGDAWRSAAESVRRHLGLDLEICRVGTGGRGLDDVTGRWSSVYRLGPSGAVLVRPDGFVAWRSPGAPDPTTGGDDVLGDVLGRVLARSPAAGNGHDRAGDVPVGRGGQECDDMGDVVRR
jgi:putative polyketide hydroxylase